MKNVINLNVKLKNGCGWIRHKIEFFSTYGMFLNTSIIDNVALLYEFIIMPFFSIYWYAMYKKEKETKKLIIKGIKFRISFFKFSSLEFNLMA